MCIHVLLAFYRCNCTAYFLTSVCLDNLNFRFQILSCFGQTTACSTGHICNFVNISGCGFFDDSATLLNYVDYDHLCIVCFCMCSRIRPQLRKSEVEDWMTIRRITQTRFPLIRCIVPRLRHLLQKSCHLLWHCWAT